MATKPSKPLTPREVSLSAAQRAMNDFIETWEIAKRREFDLKIADLKMKRDLEVIGASKEGLSKSAIARAMGIVARQPVYDILREAGLIVSLNQSNPNTVVASLQDDGTLLVRLTNAILEEGGATLEGEYAFTRDGDYWDAVELGPVQTKITNLIESDESNPVKDAVERATKEGKS